MPATTTTAGSTITIDGTDIRPGRDLNGCVWHGIVCFFDSELPPLNDAQFNALHEESRRAGRPLSQDEALEVIRRAQ